MDLVPVVISNIYLGIIVIQFVQGVRERFCLGERVPTLKQIGNHWSVVIHNKSFRVSTSNHAKRLSKQFYIFF